nr:MULTISPECIES: AEC family transporter [unclassified Actinomyces]
MAGLAVFAVVIAVGWALVRFDAVPAGSDTVLTRVCFYAATPALLVTTIADADLVAVVSRQTAAGLAAEVIGVLSAFALHYWVLRRSLAEATIGGLAGGYVNAANLGIPVLVVLLGEATAIAPVLLLQLLVLSPVAFAVLDWAGAQRQAGGAGPEPASRRGVWLAPLRNPLLLGVAVGLLINLAGWQVEGWLGGLVAGSLDALGSLAVTVMMISLGMSLAASSPRVRRRLTVARVTRLRADGPAPVAPLAPLAPPEADEDRPERGAALWLTVAWKLLLVPALAVGIGLALGLRGGELLVPVTTAALPSAQNVFMYATRYGNAKALARDCVLLTTAGFVPVELLAAALLT